MRIVRGGSRERKMCRKLFSYFMLRRALGLSNALNFQLQFFSRHQIKISLYFPQFSFCSIFTIVDLLNYIVAVIMSKFITFGNHNES